MGSAAKSLWESLLTARWGDVCVVSVLCVSVCVNGGSGCPGGAQAILPTADFSTHVNILRDIQALRANEPLTLYQTFWATGLGERGWSSQACVDGANQVGGYTFGDLAREFLEEERRFNPHVAWACVVSYIPHPLNLFHCPHKIQKGNGTQGGARGQEGAETSQRRQPKTSQTGAEGPKSTP